MNDLKHSVSVYIFVCIYFNIKWCFNKLFLKKHISLFWYYIKQIMNVFIRAVVRIFSFGERWNVPFNEAVASLNGTFHLSPHENFLTIARINIHYLYMYSLFIYLYIYLNDKGLHDFEKRMIISKLLGGCSPPPPVATALYLQV